MRLKTCTECGRVNDAAADECGHCEAAFPWACDIEPDEGTVELTLRDGRNRFWISIPPADAAQLSRALLACVPEAQQVRCQSPDSAESDEWPHASDSDDPGWNAKITRMVIAAQRMASEGMRPNLKLVKQALGVESIEDLA